MSETLSKLLEGASTFFVGDGWKYAVMIALGLGLVILAIVKDCEPLLLLPIGFGCILCNIPLSQASGPDGFMTILYRVGIENELFPILIFIGIGAMIDFTTVLRQPVTLFLGAAAQLGVFVAMVLAAVLGGLLPVPFTAQEAAAVGIVGAADGPSAIFIGQLFAQPYFSSIVVVAYSYMALVPIIQPPVIKLLTTKKERLIRMENREGKLPKYVLVAFPILVTLVAGIVAPMSTGLIGALMFGNLLNVSGVTKKLVDASVGLNDIITLLLGITIGVTMRAQDFLDWSTLLIMAIGAIAFVFDTVGGVLLAKFINLFLPEGKKLNPMIGACGISAFPMSARVISKMAKREDPQNFLIMPAIGANVAGQVGSIIVAAMIISIFS